MFRSITLMLLFLVASSMPAFGSGGGGEGGGGAKLPYFELKPSVVANLPSGGKYVRFDVQMLMQGQPDVDAVKPHAPALINEMLLMLSDQDGNKLKTPEGKEEFRKAVLQASNKVLKELLGREAIKDLFFTTFFVQ